MTYLLDTNACIDYLNVRASRVRLRMATVAVSDVRLCSIVKAELYLGAYRSTQRERNLALLAEFFPRFISMPFDDQASEAYGRVRAELMRQGRVIGPNDLLIEPLPSPTASSSSRTTQVSLAASRVCRWKIGKRPDAERKGPNRTGSGFSFTPTSL